MTPLTPSFLIATASAFVGVEAETGTTRGQMVDRFLASVHTLPGEPWDAAFVHYVGYWSHFHHVTRKSTWPLPATPYPWALGAHARHERILEREPVIGDVFLMFGEASREFVRVGIVVEVDNPELRPSGARWYRCTTIEGDTDDDGKRPRFAVLRRVRTFYPDAGDRFIRWAALDARGELKAA